ncbi:MAG: hypothetical protein LBE51_06780 [Acidovorax sp.]|jgi:hypothetical protein|nr:hypothetical protein [Acidovorax sp.]
MTTAAHPLHRPSRLTGELGKIQHERPIPLRLPKADTQRAHEAADSLELSASAYARLLFRLGDQLHRRTGMLQLPDYLMDRIAADVLAWTVESAQAARG